jgi:nuclear cap-binding protein subunit 1
MRKAVEHEIRLAYYDRIARTLPEDLQDPRIQVLPDQAPGPDYEYDDPGSHHLAPNREGIVAQHFLR